MIKCYGSLDTRFFRYGEINTRQGIKLNEMYFLAVREVLFNAGYHHAGMHKLQTEKLCDNQEQTQSPRPHRVEEVLQVL